MNQRVCETPGCGADISHRHQAARFCLDCKKRKVLQHYKNWEARQREERAEGRCAVAEITARPYMEYTFGSDKVWRHPNPFYVAREEASR